MIWVVAMVVVVVAAVAVWFQVERSLFVPEVTARKLLADGAVLIDVRTRREFQAGHIPGALHITFDEIRDKLPQHLTDKTRPILVHCLSGGRSAIARHQLRKMGYANVFNLGSLKRARKIAIM